MFETHSVTPLYVQLLEEIKSDIEEGVYGPGDKLLPELEMAGRYGVSVVTVRRAMDELAAVGLVEKRRGKGTFVAEKKFIHNGTRIISFSEACRMQGLTSGSTLLERSVRRPPSKICQRLGLPDGSQTVYISRLRFADGEPILIESNDYPMTYAGLLSEDLGGSLFEVLTRKFGVELLTSRKTIEICRANSWESRLLKVKRRHPLLLVRSDLSSATGPVYAGSQIINGERYKLIV